MPDPDTKPYPVGRVAGAVKERYDETEEPVCADDLLDVFDVPVGEPRRLNASLYKLYRKGELLRVAELDSVEGDEGYVPTSRYSG